MYVYVLFRFKLNKKVKNEKKKMKKKSLSKLRKKSDNSNQRNISTHYSTNVTLLHHFIPVGLVSHCELFASGKRSNFLILCRRAVSVSVGVSGCNADDVTSLEITV